MNGIFFPEKQFSSIWKILQPKNYLFMNHVGQERSTFKNVNPLKQIRS